MAKYIVVDYFGAFRIGSLRQNKAVRQCISGIIYIICLAIYTNRIGKGWTIWRNAAVEAALLLPMLLIYCSASIHSVQLTKMMYLCPMDLKERRQYIYGSYCFRTGVHILIAILALCIVVLNAHCSAFTAMLILLNDILAAVLVDHERHADGRRRGMVIGEIIFVIAMLSNAVQYCVIVFTDQNSRLTLFLLCIFCFVQLPLEVLYVKYIRRTLQAAVFYEAEMDQKGYER